MVSLVDIVDIKKTVTIRGLEIEVVGVNIETLAHLINAYPDLLRLAFGGRVADITSEVIMAFGPKIVNSIIAAATGAFGDQEAEAAAGRLTLGEQVTIITAAAEVTFPDGFGPFVEKLRSLGLSDGAAGSGWAPGTNSHGQPSPSPAPAEASPPS